MNEFPKLINCHDDSVIYINNQSFSIGRSLSCDHIIAALGISRFHCIIRKSGDKWTLFDRSTNGTAVNSTLYKFNETVDLKHGDVIKLGPDRLDYVFSIKNPPLDVEEIILKDTPTLVEFQQPFELEPTQTKSQEMEDKPSSDLNISMENELTCSICSELFIKAVTLNCSHTFCKYCIEQWKKTKSNCPICRKHISSIAPTLVLDNFIEKFINGQSDDAKEARKEIVKQREEIVTNAAGSSNSNNPEVIQIYSDTEDPEGDDDDEYDSDYSDVDYDYDYYVNGDSYEGAYYGGYGRCYICNQRGHWANGCPLKRR